MALTCTDTHKLLPPYIDGEFSQSERTEFEQHLGECGDCRCLVGAQQAFKTSLRTKLAPPRAPGEGPTRSRWLRERSCQSGT